MPLRWYVQRLHQKPWSTNLVTSALLMAMGDAGAQWKEHRRMQVREEESTWPETAQTTLSRRSTVRYRFYGDLSPPVDELQHELHEQHRRHQEVLEESEGKTLTMSYRLSSWLPEAILEIQSIDLYRSATMISWATLFYTPYFMSLFRFYARYMPTTGGLSQAAFRAVLTYTASIPLTTAFFAYGCTVHHVTERLTATTSSSLIGGDMREDALAGPIVVHTDLWTAIKLKLQTELWGTLQTSAKIWLPVNFINFALVPAHWRSVLLVSVSVFWNGYLSLAQHRDVDL